MSNTGFAFFLSLFLLTGLSVLGYAFYTLHASKVAGTWPTAEGRVLHCEVRESTDSDGGATFEVKVEYRYEVNGIVHHGHRIAFGYTGSSGRKAHQEIADRLAGSRSVLVRYDPADASRAVLSYGPHRSTFITLTFGATWTVFVLGFAVLWTLMSQSDTGILTTLVVTR